jgi:hypothetical protein
MEPNQADEAAVRNRQERSARASKALGGPTLALRSVKGVSMLWLASAVGFRPLLLLRSGPFGGFPLDLAYRPSQEME